jgi:hypothetical protein
MADAPGPRSAGKVHFDYRRILDGVVFIFQMPEGENGTF